MKQLGSLVLLAGLLLLACSSVLLETELSVFDLVHLDTLVARKGDVRLLTLANDEHVVGTCGEGVPSHIADVHDIVGARVLLLVDDDTNTTGVTTTSGHADVAGLEWNEADDLLGLEINLNSGGDLNLGIGEAEGATIVGNEVGDALGTESNTDDLSEFVLSFLFPDAVKEETALHIIKETEVFLGLRNAQDILEAKRVGGISTNNTIDLDVAAVHDHTSFTTG